MTTLLLSGLLGLVLTVILLRARAGRAPQAWAQAIAFHPSEPTQPDELFARLLSANLAMLENDDFNQLASALEPRRVRANLRAFWDVRSREDCLRVLQDRLARLGDTSTEEEAAFVAWRRGMVLDSAEYETLDAACNFLALEARLVERRRIGRMHLTTLACDIQHVAYLARLGFSAGHLTRDHTLSVLEQLRRHALQHFGSWADFSLAGLIGLGVRSRFDPLDLGDWQRIACSHRALVAAAATTLAHASGWLAAPTIRAGHEEAEDTRFAALAAWSR